MKIKLFLLFSLLISTITPSLMALSSNQTAQLVQLKKSFTNNINNFSKCVRGDQDCDAKKQKIYRTVLAIIGILGLAATIGGIAYFVKTRNAKPTPETKSSKTEIENDEAAAQERMLKEAEQEENATKQLLTAIEENNLINAFLSIKNGAQLNKSIEGLQIPLIKAVTQQGKDMKPMVAWLIKNGADVNAHDENGETALIAATLNLNLEMIQVLIAHHANINESINGAATPLDIIIGTMMETDSPERGRLAIQIYHYLNQNNARSNIVAESIGALVARALAAKLRAEQQ